MNPNKRTNPDVCKTLGWREWVALPTLGVDRIKAKLDTGAKTSALHAWDLEVYERENETWVRFYTLPFVRKKDVVVRCTAPISDHRWVINPGGSRERRYVITTMLRIGEEQWEIELTLTQRDEMGFRMLIGREAMRGRIAVNPSKSYVGGRRRRRKFH